MTDVIEDLMPDFKLLSSDDSFNLREKVRSRIEAVEGTFSIANAHKLPDIKVVRWRAV